MTLQEPTPKNIGESKILSDRNKRLLEYLGMDLTPTLPFETVALDAKMNGYKKQQRNLGEQLGEAMRQSSETWHDNAPADAINLQSIALSSQAGKTDLALSSSVTFEYPLEDDPEATLGSILEIIYDGDDEPEVLYLTGVTRDIESVNEHTDADFPEEFEAVTISSPIGQCLIGAHEGQERTYSANGRNHRVLVRAVLHQPISTKK